VKFEELCYFKITVSVASQNLLNAQIFANSWLSKSYAFRNRFTFSPNASYCLHASPAGVDLQQTVLFATKLPHSFNSLHNIIQNDKALKPL
jgi:hypothetical protein